MVNEYYGCQTVKDEDAIEHLQTCFTVKETALDFITKIREVTGSNEPLILVPTPTKGKTQSARTGSCHWAVQKLVQQHLGKMFNCFTFGTTMPKTFISKNYDCEIFDIDNNYSTLCAFYHSLWQTPEEKNVNVINYQKQLIQHTNLFKEQRPFTYEIIRMNYEKPLLCLPVNEKCSATINNQYNITYNNLTYVTDRIKKLENYPFFKRVSSHKSKLEIQETPPDLIIDFYKEETDYYHYKDFKNKLIIVKNHEQDTIGKVNDVKEYEFLKKKMPDYDRTKITDEIEKYFKITTTFVDTELEYQKKMKNVINGSDFNFYCTVYSVVDDDWLSSKDLFLEPSIVTKKFHYEIGNHLDFKPHLEYKVVDKDLVNKQVSEFILKMSESKKAYEVKRAEKKSLSLEEHILQQKYKLVS